MRLTADGFYETNDIISSVLDDKCTSFGLACRRNTMETWPVKGLYNTLAQATDPCCEEREECLGSYG